MNFKDITMQTRYLSFSLSRNDSFPAKPFTLTIAMTRLLPTSDPAPLQKSVVGILAEELDYVTVYHKDIRSESYDKMADGIRAQLRDILSVLEENGYRYQDRLVSAEDYIWFNTGVDHKLINQFLCFLAEVQGDA